MLEQISLGAGSGFDEAWLQDLLFRHPEIVPIREIEPGFADLVPICRELPTAHGPIDNLFMTPQGDIVMVEAKLWRNPQARREVVAQALDYASCLFEMSYEAFEAAVLKADLGSAKPASLYELVRDCRDVLVEEVFVDTVSANLARGRIVILVVGDGIRTETQRLTEALQSHAGFHFTFALVELSVFRMPGSGDWLVLPRTLARTTMIERGIVRLEGGQMRISPALSATTASPSLGSISAEQFFEAMQARGADVPEKLKAFIAKLDEIGVYAEFQQSLNLKWDQASGKPINLGYVRRGGQVWTEMVNLHAPKELSRAYVEDLARAWGGQVDRATFGEDWHVRFNGQAPRIEAVIDKLDDWFGCIERFIRRMQAHEAGQPAPEIPVTPALAPISDSAPS